jgi:hypothetical protein
MRINVLAAWKCCGKGTKNPGSPSRRGVAVRPVGKRFPMTQAGQRSRFLNPRDRFLALAVGQDRDGRIEVFGLGPDNEARHNWQTAASDEAGVQQFSFWHATLGSVMAGPRGACPRA